MTEAENPTKRVELTAVEHGLALLLAMGVADLASAAVELATGGGPLSPRSSVAWAVSDAIPLAVTLALLAARPRARSVLLLLALGAGFLVEATAVSASAAFLALESVAARPRDPVALLAEALRFGYGTPAGFMLIASGRALGVYLGARARGLPVEGPAIALPFVAAWGALIGLQLAAAGGLAALSAGAGAFGQIAAFAVVLAVSLPLLERAVPATLVRLGVSEERPSP